MRTRGKRWGRVASAAVIAGAATPAIMRWLRRTGAKRRAIDMKMTLVVERPIHEVFEFCRDFENFPEVVDMLLSVEDFQDGRSHWAVRSPTGETIEWDATVTKYVPSSVIAWESVSGSPVHATGIMRFAPLSPSETRVDVKLAYQPKRTALGEALRALLIATNNTRLRSELARASVELGRRSPASKADDVSELAGR